MRITRESIDGKFPRYLAQRDRYSCSVIAIINYWKYCGLNVFNKDVSLLKRIFKSKGAIGTEEQYIESVMNFKFEYVPWGKFRNHLLYRGPIIVSDSEHCFFVPCFFYEKVKHYTF